MLIILFFLIGSIIGYQYPTFLNTPKTYVTGIIHLIFPEQTNRPEKNNYEYKFTYKDSVGVAVEKND